MLMTVMTRKMSGRSRTEKVFGLYVWTNGPSFLRLGGWIPFGDRASIHTQLGRCWLSFDNVVFSRYYDLLYPNACSALWGCMIDDAWLGHEGRVK